MINVVTKLNASVKTTETSSNLPPPACSRESRKALKVLEQLAVQPRLTSPIAQRSMVSRGSVRGAGTPRLPSVLTT